MSDFSASDAAVSGFRFIGRRPWVVLTWAGIFLAYDLIITMLMIALPGDTLGSIRTFAEVNETDPEAALAMLPAVGLVMLVGVVGYLALSSVMFAAAYRALLRPSETSLGHVRFGKDELRIAAVIILSAALLAGYNLLLAFVGGTLWAIGGALPGLVRSLYQLALLVGLICALVYPLVRLSLCMPMTFADRHVRIFESWKPTRGFFWPLFGAYALAAVLIFVMLVVEWAIVGVVAMVAIVSTGGSFTSLTTLFQPDTSTLAAYLTPATLIALLLNALASAASLAVLTGPVSEAYKYLVEGEDADEDAPEPEAAPEPHAEHVEHVEHVEAIEPPPAEAH